MYFKFIYLLIIFRLLELIGGKAAVLSGIFRDGTAFAGNKLDILSSVLVENG